MPYNAFSKLMKDIVVLVKPDGARFEEIKASVSRDQITVFDTSVVFEEGDIVERERPGGIVERYTVLDTGYQKAFYQIPAHYDLQVRKETAIPRSQPGPSHNYYLNGPNSRVNSNSIDASVNTVSTTSSPVFVQLREALAGVEDEEQREELLSCVVQMEASQGSTEFMARYQAFVQAAANHMTVVAPFIPALTQLLS